MPHPTALVALNLMQCQRHLKISHVMNIGNVFYLSAMAFCLRVGYLQAHRWMVLWTPAFACNFGTIFLLFYFCPFNFCDHTFYSSIVSDCQWAARCQNRIPFSHPACKNPSPCNDELQPYSKLAELMYLWIIYGWLRSYHEFIVHRHEHIIQDNLR